MHMLKIRQMLQSILWRISPRLCLHAHFFKQRGYFPNFQNPMDLSEIILSEILSGEICKYAPFVDKLTVREHITAWGLDKYLPELYGTWNSAEEINFDILPEAFALKTNHGCGHHYLCPNKKFLDSKKAREVIAEALRLRFGNIEKQYDCITPRCFAEEYIQDTRGGGQPLDYKFMCCDGTIRCVLICSERDTGTRLATYDLQWNRLEWIRDFEKSTHEFERPQNFDEMIKIAETIAKQFTHVRVDLYSLPSGKIYIGELTFTPQGGIMSYFTNSAIKALGHVEK